MSQDAASTLATLRRKLALIEGANLPRARHSDDGPLSGCAAAASAVALATLNEVAAARESEMTAATGFLLPLCAWASGTAGRRATVWIAEDMALAESGAPYGPGLDAFGLAPEQLIRIAVSNAREVPWAMEEALRSRGVGAVIGELRSGDIGLTVSRRLSLAAGRDGATAFLLRSVPSPAPLAAATRWVIGAAPSAHGFGPGPPRFTVRLTRNRHGNPGSWLLEWNSDGQRFDIAAADRQPVAETASDRPPRAASSA
ncbi:MAG: hypothetical protein P8Z80_18595 [Pseudolabrys sp.]|jgi:protein ImuA